jgi:hypothetical protein
MSKMIQVSDELKEIMDEIKKKEGHTSFDSLIRTWKTESEMYRIMKGGKFAWQENE